MSLPHTETTVAYDWCAFTSKTRKMATMMHQLGWPVTLYAAEANEAECAEHVPIVTAQDRARWFPDFDPTRDLWNEYGAHYPHFREMNARAIDAIRDRAEPGDLLLLIGGLAQKPIADALPGLPAVEWGIGYPGVFAPYRVFESYAWAHHLARPDDVRLFDTVIPNFFELDQFPLRGGEGDYLLYFGRLTPRKGLDIVAEIQKATGLDLLVAGQGDHTLIDAPHEYLGVITNAAERAAIMGQARCLLAPTTYLEPFGAVAVEAQLCGTPAVTTDWGAFTETVSRGYRCRTLAQFVEAVELARYADRPEVRRHAGRRYGTETIGPLYADYFTTLATLWGDGWYALPDWSGVVE